MNELTIVFNGKTYPLATTLRVAYMVQGQHNHKPYAEVFKDMGTMTLEEQIGFIYCAFACANKEEAKSITLQKFTEYYLDNMNLKDLLKQLEILVKGIMGENESSEIEVSQDSTGVEGN